MKHKPNYIAYRIHTEDKVILKRKETIISKITADSYIYGQFSTRGPRSFNETIVSSTSGTK